MTADAPQIAFGNVSLGPNALQIGGSTYALHSVTGIHLWEDNDNEYLLTRAKKILVRIAIATGVAFIFAATALKTVDTPLEMFGLIGMIIFWPLLIVSVVALIYYVSLLMRVKAREASNPGEHKSRLTVSFSDGASRIVSGSPSDLQALQSAMQQAMGAC